MNHSHITINGVEPAFLSLRHPLGIDLEWTVHMHRQTGEPVDPTLAQLILLPRSQGGAYPYDVEAVDVTGGVATIRVPGSQLTDTLGYNVEFYSRAPNAVPGDPPKPTGLLAKGALITEGSAYASSGPFNMINVPVVVGPPGPQGDPGVRGSKWFTGVGDPTLTGVVDGDMYLDETTGNVWRYDGETWMKGSF